MTAKTLPWGCSVQRNFFFDEAIDQLNLRKLWSYVEKTNDPDFRGDQVTQVMHYHSTEHMKQVTAIALWLLRQESHQRWQYDVCAFPLAVACMVHDANHSLGQTSDAENIERAVEFFELALTKLEDKRLEENRDTIIDLIRITQFPYDEERAPRNLIQRCIRDADILYGIQPDVIDHVMDGLRDEVNSSPDMSFTQKEWAAGRVPFLRTVTMFTSTALDIMSWELSDENDHNHQSRVDAWMSDGIYFRVTQAHRLCPNMVVYCPTGDDSTPARRLIERVEDFGEGLNIIFDGDVGISLRNGESIVYVERSK